jgi:hypothetical protein
MAQVPYRFVLTDKNFNQISTLNPVSNRQVSFVLNGVGQAYFEMMQDNPLLPTLGVNFLTTYYGLQVYRNNVLFWQGLIDEVTPGDSPKSSMNQVGFRASNRLQDFSDVLITQTTTDGYVDGLANTNMGDNMTTFFNACKGLSNSPISDITIGQIQNPTYSDGTIVNFATQDQVPVMDLLTTVGYLADLSNADYYIDQVTNEFYFLDNYGNANNTAVLFRYIDTPGLNIGNNIRDFKVDLNIRNMNNNPVAYGTNTSDVLTEISSVMDTASINQFKLRQHIIATPSMNVTEDQGLITTYLNNQLPLLQVPQYASTITLSSTVTPFDGWGLGDVVGIQIQRGIIQMTQPQQQRIMGVIINIDETNTETIELNYVQPKQALINPNSLV